MALRVALHATPALIEFFGVAKPPLVRLQASRVGKWLASRSRN